MELVTIMNMPLGNLEIRRVDRNIWKNMHLWLPGVYTNLTSKGNTSLCVHFLGIRPLVVFARLSCLLDMSHCHLIHGDPLPCAPRCLG